MKKVVLMTGVLAAGLAAAPVAANAAAPSSPKIQEVNAEDANDVYGNYDGQIKSRFDDIAYIELLIKDQKFPFTEDKLSFKLKNERVLIKDLNDVETINTVGWHDKAKAEVAKSISDFRHELHDMQDLLNHLWTTLTPEEFKAAVNEDHIWDGHTVNISKIMDRDYAQKTLLDRFLELNQDWYIYSYYQQLGKNTWTQYFAYTQTDEYKHVNDTYDVKYESLVEDMSIDFRTFYEAKHADRVKTDPATTFQLRTLCAETGCCVENLGEIQTKYDAYLKAIEDEKKLVAQYHEDRENLLSNGLEGVKAYTTLAKEIANLVDPTTIKKAGYPDEDSDKATSRINALKATIDAQAAVALEYITTFNAQRGYDAANNKYNWEKDFVGEGKDDLTEPKYLANAKAKLVDLTSKVEEYNALIAAAQKNLENYIKLVDDINALEDWSRVAGKKHDADGDLGNHSDVAYYESDAFDTEVPAAYQDALDKAKAAYEGFALRELKTSETAEKALADAADKAYEDYSKLVDDANANEKEHDEQHKTLDPLKKTYEKYLNEFRGLINDRNEENSIDETPELTDGDVVTELYPLYTDAEKGININNNGNYIHRVTLNSSNTPTQRAKGLFGNGYWGTQQSIANVYEAYVAAKAAYDKANIDIEAAYNAGKSVERKEELNTTFDALKTKNGEFNGALTAAKDNEVAFLEGVKAYNEALDKAHHDLDEYAHHPETFGHWSTQIQDVLDQFLPVRDELVQAYNVDAAARDYVNNTLPGKIAALNQAVADLEKQIKDNQTARDANEAAINAALTDLAALKAKYDTVKFTPEHKTSDELATTLQADFQKAWKSYVENDLDVPALYDEKTGATESDLHFAQTAVGVDFDADIKAMLSDIKSENSVDFDIHHQATNDYALNLAAVKYIKDVVIPALNDTFDALVQANQEAHDAQYNAYVGAQRELEYYASVNPVPGDMIPCTKEEQAVADAKVAADTKLVEYKAKIDDAYVKGEANHEDVKEAIETLHDAYVALCDAYDDALEAAQNNDAKYAEQYKALMDVEPKFEELKQNWEVKPLTTILDNNGWSDKADENVKNAYTAAKTAYEKYLSDAKSKWLLEESAATATKTLLDGELKTYKDALKTLANEVTKAQNNDAELTDELGKLADELPLTPYNEKVAYTAADANLKNLLDALNTLKVKCDGDAYADLKNRIVDDWEKERFFAVWYNSRTHESFNEQDITAYKNNVAAYNALMEKVNACAAEQAALDAAKTDINALPVVASQLDDHHGTTKVDEDRKGILDEEVRIQGLIETLEIAVLNEYKGGAASDWKNKDGEIAKAIADLKTKAKAENDKFVANENAYNSLDKNIHDLVADAENTSTIEGPAKEAFEKAVAGYITELEGLADTLEEKYLAEKATEVSAATQTRYEELLALITASKELAKEVGKSLGDLNGNNEIDEWDSTGSNPDGIVEIVRYNRAYNKLGDMDLDGKNTVKDINLLNNYLWHGNFNYNEETALKIGAAHVEFEGSIDLMVAGNTVALALNNNTAVDGIQFDVTVPYGAKLSSVIGTARAEGLQVMSSKLDESTYRVLVVSLSGSQFINGNEGNLVSFNVAGEGEVEVSNVIVSADIARTLNGAAVSLGQTTGIDEVASEGNSEIFGLDGIRQSVMKAGVNIVRGANGAVKKIFK